MRLRWLIIVLVCVVGVLGLLSGKPAVAQDDCPMHLHQLEGQARAVVNNATPDPAFFRQQPDTSGRLLAEIPPGTAVFLMGETRCGDGWVWVQVRYRETTGWIAEVDHRELYNLLPWYIYDLTNTPVPPSRTPTRTPVTRHSPTPSPRPSQSPARCSEGVDVPLVIGEQGLVRRPGMSLPMLASLRATQPFRWIPSTSLFWVLAGPECIGGYHYWLIDYNGNVGWIQVSGSPDLPYGGVWVEPVPAG